MPMNQSTDPNTPWWQTAVIYQVYPRSFQDTDADGIGDLRGIYDRLPYLASLGIDAVWISPIYPSPMADFGYDVSNYTGIDPMFGTMEDFDRLIECAHSLKLRIILDFVPNHTSDQHPWFLESCSSRENPKRDWYIWHDPEAGSSPSDVSTEPNSERSADGEEKPAAPYPPNNWMSHFGGSAWNWDGTTGQFYLHSFLPQQPDLNWRNPEVRRAMYDAMLFWLDKGVDGFRMDVLWLLIKDDHFRDNPVNPDWQPGTSSFGRYLPLYTADRPETHAIVAEMRHLLDSYPGNRLLIGEIYLPIRELVRYYGSSAPAPTSARHDMTGVAMTSPSLTGAPLPFNFHLIQTPWRTSTIAQLIRDYEAVLPPGAWPNWVLGNHDQPRLASRLDPEQARAAAVLLLTLRGTPTLYYGDELGMTDAHIPPNLVQDPAEKRQPGIGMGRDPERTPMLWDDSPNAGFTHAASAWLPVLPSYPQQCVAVETADPRSMLSLYRRLLALRRAHPALHSGTVSEISPKPGQQTGVLSYLRASDSERILVLLNLTNEPQPATVPPGNLLLSSAPRRTTETAPRLISGPTTLGPAESLIILLD
jgi:alpha-glucosidase